VYDTRSLPIGANTDPVTGRIFYAVLTTTG